MPFCLAGLVACRRWPPTGTLLFHPPVYLTLLMLFLAAGGVRGSLHRPQLDAQRVAHYNDQDAVVIRGVVARYPEERGASTRYLVEVMEVEAEDGIRRPAHGKVLVTRSPYPAFQYGDLLELSGELETPPAFEDFDYRSFLAHQDIFSVMYYGEATRVAGGRGTFLHHGLYTFRSRAAKSVQQILPEPQASLLVGMLLGTRSGTPQELMASFNRTGTTHVLVISGMHFAILSAILLFLGRRLLGKRWGTWLAIILLVLYTILVGAAPNVVRAAIMGVFTLFALLLGRRSTALNTLALAVLLMTALHPGQMYHVGFQLSVLATLGLILFRRPLGDAADRVLQRQRWISLHGRPGAYLRHLVNGLLLVSVAAQLMTAPLVAGTFGRLSPVSLLTNMLILPVQPWVLAGGGAAALAGMVWLPLGKLLAVIPYAGLSWTVAVVRGTASLPLASIEIGPFPAAWTWSFYGLVGGWWWLRKRITRERLRREIDRVLDALPSSLLDRKQFLLWAASAIFAFFPWWVVAELPDGRLHLYMLDVGQGDALLIVTPDGKQILVDGGPDPAPLLARLGERMPPWDRTIELVVLTHADSDHLGGLPELLTRYRAGAVVDSGYGHTTPLWEVWEERVEARESGALPARVGQRWSLGAGVWLELLGPVHLPDASRNNNSVVVRLQYGSFCALLTGDIEEEAERQLLRRKTLLPCQVLKVAHHGSNSSSTLPFLEAVSPQYALISSGADNRFGHPHREVVQRLERMGTRLFRTDRQGTIHLATDGDHLWIQTTK